MAVFHALRKLGYDHLTLEKIANEISISPAALSKRFGSKQKLLMAYIRFTIQQTKLVFERAEQSPLSPLAALREVFVQYSRIDPVSLANITSLYLAGIADPDMYRLSRKRLQIIDAEIQKLLVKAMQNRELKKCNPALISRTLISSLTGSIFVWMRDQDRDLEEWIDDCFDVVLKPYKIKGGAANETRKH
ncbi:TetR/AcrR family transcriptional regulator [Thermoactinomyces mirandus]|nr:TetR/AcrR family transcriptional regulator [Thermoactinomyces mirandus]